MKVFISHSSKDSRIAKELESTLRNHRIDSYLDLYDERLERNRGNAEITPKIVKELERCNILLAIISETTQKSWWVPFEIGVARANLLSISSYTSLNEDQLPEFLLEWPRLYSKSDLSTYIESIKSEQYILDETKVVLEGTYSFTDKAMKYEDSYKKLRSFEDKIINKLKQKRGK